MGEVVFVLLVVGVLIDSVLFDAICSTQCVVIGAVIVCAVCMLWIVDYFDVVRRL